MTSIKYQRTENVVNRVYIRYMIPAMLSAIGISLSEFADSMVVSQLLSSDAFAIINLGAPIALLVSMIYSITGIGGSLLFAESLGKKNRRSAENYFTISSAFALLIGMLLFVLLMVFRSVLGDMFGCPGELRTEFDAYILRLSCFVPVGVLLMHFSYFLPVIGNPFLSMGLVVAVNVLNIILDVFFIKTLGMGCEGAATATTVSYIIVFVVALLIWRFRKLPLSFCRFHAICANVKKIVKKGLPSGSVQAGYAVTTVFCNYLMNLAFGMNGVLAMSLFAQLDSFISIALTGIVDNNGSFAAMMKGEGDYFGIRSLCRRVTLMIVSTCILLSGCFLIFMQQVAALFNITDNGTLTLIKSLITMYVLYYPLRSILLVLRDIYNILDRSMYALLLGVFDKLVSVPLVGGALFLLFGGYGLIAAFPISMILILCFIVGVNRRIVRKSSGRYSPILLLDEEYPMKILCSYSVKSLDDVAGIGSYIGNSLSDMVPSPNISNKLCLAAEEMGTYIVDHCGADTAVDFLISSNGREYILTCRSPGKPFYPISEKKGELSPNELLLTGLFEIRHEYIFGLNSTKLTIGAER